MDAKWILGAVVVLGLLSWGCQNEAQKQAAKAGPEQTFAFHKAMKIGMPMEEVAVHCPKDYTCKLTDSMANEITYVGDSAGRVKAIVLLFPAVEPPSVQASQEYFRRVKRLVGEKLGKGESFLESGDPTYWPSRLREKRVVGLTMDNADRTVLAIGPGGPDADKIGSKGVANNPKEVQKYWEKATQIPALQPKKDK